MKRPEALVWLRANGHDLGPLTGQDTRTLIAIDACWQLYAGADDEGRVAAFHSIALLLRKAMQRKVWYLAVELAARSMDWDERERQRRELRRSVPSDDHGYLLPPGGGSEPTNERGSR